MKNKSAIKDMFFGKRGTYEQVPLSEEFSKLDKKMFDFLDIFLEKLSDEQKTLFDKAFNHISDRNAEYATDHFVEGFKFGLLLGIE